MHHALTRRLCLQFFCNQKNNGEQCSPSQVLVSIEGLTPLRQQIYEVDARFHATR